MKLRQLLHRLRRHVEWPWVPLLALLTGCAISTPVTLRPPAAGDGPDDMLQVSLTHAVIDGARREPFDRYVRLIAAQLPAQPGLVSHSIRRELLGDQVWTMTVWRSAADRSRFFGSGLHLEAMATASSSIVHVRSVRLELRRSELPLDWPRALRALGAPPWGASDETTAPP